MEIEIKERKEKEAAGKGREQRMKYKSVRERRSIAVAANFPNFANKLPETKILKRIVKVLTCSRPLQFIRASLPPFLADCVYLYLLFRRKHFSLPRLVILSAFYAFHSHIIGNGECSSRVSSRQRFPKKTLKTEHA